MHDFTIVKPKVLTEILFSDRIIGNWSLFTDNYKENDQ